MVWRRGPDEEAWPLLVSGRGPGRGVKTKNGRYVNREGGVIRENRRVVSRENIRGMSREKRRAMPREKSREMPREKSRELPREKSRGIFREMKRGVTREKFFLFFLATLCSQFTLSLAAKSPAHTIRYDGEVNIGVLVNLHEGSSGVSSNSVGEGEGCGHVNMEAVQQVLAAKWAVDVINNQSLPHELNIGLQIHDTCESGDLSQNHLYSIITAVQNNMRTPPLIGMIGIGEPKSLREASAALNAFHVPVVSVSPGIYSSMGHNSENTLTTAPDMAGQARALANIAYELNADRVALISSSQSSVSSFLAEATTMGIRVPDILELHPRQVNIGPAVEGFLVNLATPRPVVAMVLEAGDSVAVAEHLKYLSLPVQPVWLVGSLGLDLRRLKSWKIVFNGGAFVEPHMPELREFKNYFLGSLKTPDSSLSPLAEEYMTENFGCVSDSSTSRGVKCKDVPLKEMDLRFQQDPQVSFVVKAVSALTAAFRLVQLDGCGESVEAACLRSVSPDLHQDILNNLHKLSFTSMGGVAKMEGTRHHFTKAGRLVANKQIVYSIDTKLGLEPIGWYSEDEGLKINENVELTKVEITTTTVEPITAPRSSPLVNNDNTNDRTNYGRSIDEEKLTRRKEGKLNLPNELSTDDLILVPRVATYESFMGRTWALVVVSVAIFGICISMWMVIYVFLKMCDRTLSGNQSMGVLLLMGVTSLFISVIPWLLPPNETICAVRHFFHPIIFCLCFGILLVKVMQLRSLVSVGLGGKIPQVNQLLSLFFMVMVQVVITTEWYVINSPLGTRVTDGYPECNVSRETFLLLHIYPSLLLLLTFFYGMSVLKIKRNFNEGRWVTCATIFIIPIFAAWSVVYYFAPVYFHDPSISVSILAVAGILLSSIFFPKMHTIAQQSKVKQLKQHSGGGSDSTLFTTFTDAYPPYNLYYPMPGSFRPSTSHYHPHTKPTHHPKPNPVLIQPVNSRLNRFNGLNYLADLIPGNSPTSYTDWSRDHTPGTSHLHSPHRADCTARIYQKNSKTPEVILSPVSKRNSRKNSPESNMGGVPAKSSMKHSPGVMMNPNGLQLKTPHFDKKSRVYHIQP